MLYFGLLYDHIFTLGVSCMAHRILMIDDDREMVILGKLILEREGFDVLSAYTGKEGLQVLDSNG